MSRISATSLLIILVCAAAGAQTSTNPPATSPTGPDSTSQQSQPASSPDTSAPAQPAQPAPTATQDKKESGVKHKLEELSPNCINIFAYRHCWSSPPPPAPKPAAKDVDPEYAKDMDVGEFYLKERKNYAGAAMRFRDALAHKANDPAATFKLAQSLEGLRQTDEAREQYQAYLKLEPQGQFAGEANKAIDRLQGKGAIGKSKQTAPDSH